MNFKPLMIGAIGAVVGIAGIEAYHRMVPVAAPPLDFGSIIRDYIISHPEVLQEAMAEFEKRQAALDSDKARSAVKNNSDALFNSARHVVVGNRQGDVTLVEFFDYNCGYCKQALADLNALMKSDTKLKVVLKEFPVLGPASIESAQVAVAVRMQDPTGEKYLAFHQKLLTSRGQADKARALAAARDAGADMARLEQDIGSEEVKESLAESFKLAEQLGINGTPSYVVGSDVVIGAVGLATLRDKVRQARCTATATC